jgi:ABC-type multidrug transport system fused ATPase/permease subunit
VSQQSPLTPAPSVQNTPDPDQVIDQDIPDITRRYRGWYPRWWFLSAIFCALLIGSFKLTEYLTCRPSEATRFLCQIDTQDAWEQVIVVAVIWLIFLLGWLIAFLFGVRPIEITRQQDAATRFFRALSQSSIVDFLLLVYAIIAFACILVIWLSEHFNAIEFALASLIIFVASCNILYKREPGERGSFVITCGAVALLCLIVMFLSGRFQLTILCVSLLLIIISIWSLVRAFIRGGQPQNQTQAQRGASAAPVSPQDQIADALIQSVSPLHLLRSLMYTSARPWLRNRAQNSARPIMPAAQQTGTYTSSTAPTVVLAPSASTNQINVANQKTQPLDEDTII